MDVKLSGLGEKPPLGGDSALLVVLVILFVEVVECYDCEVRANELIIH